MPGRVLRPFAGALLTSLAFFSGCGSRDALPGEATAGRSGGAGFDPGGLQTVEGSRGPISSSAVGSVSTGGTGGGAANETGATTGALAAGGVSFSEFIEPCPGLPVQAGASGLDPQACVGTGYERECFHQDVILLIDASAAMLEPAQAPGFNRWQVVRAGVEAYLEHEDAREQRVGARLFHWNPGDGCAAGPDEQLSVALGSPSDVAASIRALLDTEEPGGEPNAAPALRGVCDYARRESAFDPLLNSSIILVTASAPQACEVGGVGALEGIAQAAQTETSGVRVHVVEVDGDYGLAGVARAGGTQPIRIRSDSPTRLVDALRAIIRSYHIATCEMEVPMPPRGRSIDLDSARVLVNQRAVPRVRSAADCATGGWYYLDGNGQTPPRVTLCPCSCDSVGCGQVQLSWTCE